MICNFTLMFDWLRQASYLTGLSPSFIKSQTCFRTTQTSGDQFVYVVELVFSLRLWMRLGCVLVIRLKKIRDLCT